MERHGSYKLDELSTQDSNKELLSQAASTSIDSSSSDNKCGYKCCHPKWMESWSDIRLFTALLCLLACINGAISASYLPSVITAIEKRFELSSITTGLIVASYEVGAIIAVIFVSYLGDRKHVPYIIGTGAILVGTGTCLSSLPHFIAPLYSNTVEEYINVSSESVCSRYNSSSIEEIAKCNNQKIKSGNELYTFIFMIAQSLIGVGSTPILTLGLSYIDSYVSKKSSPLYLAVVYATATLGPVLGFGCGAALMEVYVDFISFRSEELPVGPADPAWVGAWWVGFLIFGLLTFICAPPFFAFPRSLQPPKSSAEDHSPTESAAKGMLDGSLTDDSFSLETSAVNKRNRIKDFPRAFFKLIKNPVYMLLNFATVFEMIIVTGFITYVPKYLETQFNIKSSQANLYTGSLAIPGAVLGILFTGTILKKLKPTVQGTMQITVIFSILCLGCFSLAFPFGCKNTRIAGITAPYTVSSIEMTTFDSDIHNLTNDCYSQCSCDMNLFDPVCADNHLTFFSACHAGCRTSINGTFKECSCVKNFSNESDIISPMPEDTIMTIKNQVVAGACVEQCEMLVPFMLLIFGISFLVAAMKTPITMVTMRCVEEELRSFSLGIQLVIIRSLALLPAPIMFGKVIDTTCIWWKFECGERKNCLLYNVESFRYKYAGISCGLHVFALFLFGMAWTIVQRRERNQRVTRQSTQPNTVEFYLSTEAVNLNQKPEPNIHQM